MVFCDIASFYAPRGGGVTTYHTRKLAFFAKASAHRYVIIAPAAADGVETVRGGTVFRVRGFRYDANYRHLHRLPALRRILADVRPDVLEFGSPYLDFWLGRLAARGSSAVQTAFYHCDFPDTYARPFVDRRLHPAANLVSRFLYRYVRHAYGRLDATLVASEFIRTKLGRLGLKNLKLMPLGVDQDTFHPGRRDEAFRRGLGLGPGDKLLFYCGRYREDKGVGLLLEAAPRFLADRRLHLAMAGTGPCAERVRALAGRCARVHDLGFIADREDLARTYASSDGFLSPGGRETFGLGIIEAVACGLPVLSADSGAGAEIVRRFGCGRLFRTGRASDLAAETHGLMEADFGQAVAEARRHLEQEHDWDRIFGEYIEFHGQLKERKAAGRPLHP